MKKILSIGLAVLLVVAVVGVALAVGPAKGRGVGPGYGPGWMMGGGYYDNLSADQVAKIEQFQKEVEPLREQMFQLRSEMFQLRQQEPIDWDAVSAKQKEMVDLRIQIQKKASDAGIADLVGKRGGFGPGSCGGPGGCGNCGGPGRGPAW